MSKILATDLDGTLLYPKQRNKFLSKKNLEFCRKFIDAGNRLVLVTSRSPSFCERLIKEIDRNVDMISMTGSYIKIDGKVVKDTKIDSDVAFTLLKEINELCCPFGYALTTVNYPVLLVNGPKTHMSKFQKKFYVGWYNLAFGFYTEELTFDEGQFVKEIEQGNLYAIKIFFGISRKKNKINKEWNKKIRALYPSIEASWVGLANEISPKGCSKAESLQFYLEQLKEDPKNLYVVGDSGNDVTMFKAFYDNSFVLKHGYPSVKKYAKYKISQVHKLAKYLLEEEK